MKKQQTKGWTGEPKNKEAKAMLLNNKNMELEKAIQRHIARAQLCLGLFKEEGLEKS